MNARPYLVRLFAMAIDGWFAEKPDIDRLVKVFDPKETEQSVYEVENGEEEWLVAAAHVLTTKKRPDATSVLRLREDNLRRFGITVDRRQLGTTGVSWVDYRHRNLLATPEQLRELVKYMVERCSRGQDWVRRIEKPYIERSLRRFCGEPHSRCPPHVKQIARWALKEADSRNLDLDEIRQEFLTIEFPDEIIQPRAYLMGRGDQQSDWYAAVEVLRQEYTAHYLPTITDRFNLH
ncbi:MAG: hypothetical protein HYS12_10120 [Planctomycetes bacterium]|nr:hypothetical protein [Planctomycetota bacterium]